MDNFSQAIIIQKKYCLGKTQGKPGKSPGAKMEQLVNTGGPQHDPGKTQQKWETRGGTGGRKGTFWHFLFFPCFFNDFLAKTTPSTSGSIADRSDKVWTSPDLTRPISHPRFIPKRNLSKALKLRDRSRLVARGILPGVDKMISSGDLHGTSLVTKQWPNFKQLSA